MDSGHCTDAYKKYRLQLTNTYYYGFNRWISPPPCMTLKRAKCASMQDAGTDHLKKVAPCGVTPAEDGPPWWPVRPWGPWRLHKFTRRPPAYPPASRGDNQRGARRLVSLVTRESRRSRARAARRAAPPQLVSE